MRSTLFLNIALFAAGGLACPAADPQDYHGWHHHPSATVWSTISVTSSAAASSAIAATSAIIPSSSSTVIPVLISTSAFTAPVQVPSAWSSYALSSAATVPTSVVTSTPGVSTPTPSPSTPAAVSSAASASAATTSATATGTGTYVDMCETSNAVLPSMPTPTDDTESNWWVYSHNIHRRNHSAPDASWSTELANDAQIIIGQHNGVCAGDHVMNVNGDSYGQNIAYSQFWSSGTGPTTVSNEDAASGSTGMWYSEADNWTAAQYGPGFAENHFTQMIWKTSTSIGCATQQCGSQSASGYSNGYWTVCNYQATGNMNDDPTMISMGLCQPALPGT